MGRGTTPGRRLRGRRCRHLARSGKRRSPASPPGRCRRPAVIDSTPWPAPAGRSRQRCSDAAIARAARVPTCGRQELDPADKRPDMRVSSTVALSVRDQESNNNEKDALYRYNQKMSMGNVHLGRRRWASPRTRFCLDENGSLSADEPVGVIQPHSSVLGATWAQITVPASTRRDIAEWRSS
jgi:hypothetical protein